MKILDLMFNNFFWEGGRVTPSWKKKKSSQSPDDAVFLNFNFDFWI